MADNQQIFESIVSLGHKIELLNSFLAQQKILENRKELFAALAAAQSEFRIAFTVKESNYFKSRYEDISEVIRATRPALTKNSLSVNFCETFTDDGGRVLTCILAHSSGQTLESKARIISPKDDLAASASQTAFLKRQLYAEVTGVSIADEDDDGECAMSERRGIEEKGVALNTKHNPKENKKETITREQLEELNYELAEYTDIAEKVMDALRIEFLGDMPKDKFLTSINRIRQIKQARNGK